MTRFRVVLLTIAFVCGPGAASAQPRPTGPDGRDTLSEPFVHQVWTVRDGLPVNGITRLLQGRDGYLWLATWDGLVRFDGVRFTVFNAANTEQLPSNRIVELLETSDGSLWLLTEQHHLVRYRNGEFTHFGAAHGLSDGTARVTYVGADGQLWIGTDDGVRMLAGERFVPVAEQMIRGPVTALLRAADRALWVGTPNGLYQVRNDAVTRFDTTHGLVSNRITALIQDRAGDIWIGTAAGVHRYRAGVIERTLLDNGVPFNGWVGQFRAATAADTIWVRSEASLHFVAGNRLSVARGAPGGTGARQVHFDPAGAAWYTAVDGLYHGGRNVFRVPPRAPGDALPQLGPMAWDHEGSIWVGMPAGLYRLTPAHFRVYSTAEGLADGGVATVLEDRSGAVWIGTNRGGLSRLADGQVTTFTVNQGFPTTVSALLQDRHGDLWLGTGRRGIRHCRLPALVCGAPPGGQPAGNVQVLALHEDRDGAVWAGTRSGLFRLRDGAWERMDEGEGPPPPIVRAFLETRDGALWMATTGSGLRVYRQGRLSRITTADGLPSDLIRALHEDEHGRIWVGTEGRGLARLTVAIGPAGETAASAIRTIRHRDGLFDEVIHRILGDDYGRLWMSSNRGIFRVSLAELDYFADGRIPNIHATGYTERDGLRNREANGGSHPAGMRARDGRLWFPTQDGAAVIDPSDVGHNEVPPPVVVERVVARGRAVDAGATAIALASNERDFEIEYTAFSFVAPENMRFRYRLHGLTDEWTEVGTRRTAFYTNVPPGRYTFQVVASNNDGIWSEAGASLALRVAPYFHETGAARAALLLTLGLLAAAGMRRWLGRQRRREQELTQLVEARTVELRWNEQQLETRNAQLAAQASTLAELHQARSRLFANLSHEFRTPLTLILGPLRSLLDGRYGRLDPSVRDQHELMLRNGQRLLRLINQILDLARLQARAVSLDRRTHDLVGFARTATLAFAPLAERRGIALRFHCDRPALAFTFDGEQLEKVLLNLLSNALKFTERGGTVEVTVDADAGAAEIRVQDTGKGIAPHELPHVFERFYQADASATRRHEGTGIGLALARELVELHGGDIRVESTPGVGSTFTVRLPRSSTAPVTAAANGGVGAEHPADRSRQVPDTAWPATPVPRALMLSTDDGDVVPSIAADEPDEDRTTVLVVDDNPDVRAYVRSILAASYRVIEAGDGRAGLELARAALPDLIVADVMMPEIDGLALGRALKDDALTDAIPVVLLTARAAPEDQVAGLETGADAYLVKPFDPDVLEAQVANLLAQRRRLRERFRLGEAAPPVTLSATPSALESRLRPLVEAHLTDPDFGPETLAAAAALSYHQLYRALRDELETTPSRFIRTVRVDCAAELLRQGAGSITEIAYSVGFESLSYFRRAFRERFGTSPTEHLAAAASPLRPL